MTQILVTHYKKTGSVAKTRGKEEDIINYSKQLPYFKVITLCPHVEIGNEIKNNITNEAGGYLSHL